MLKRLMKTQPDASALLIRLGLGVVMFPHGAQKALGVFTVGGGFNATVDAFEKNFGMPVAITALVIAAEFLGSIGLVLGFLSRIAALGIAAVMVGAIQMVHLKNGFFMNWYDVPGKGEGFEFHILVIAMALAVMIKGSGAFSFDRAFTKKGDH
jgi:putative oxidoreductase